MLKKMILLILLLICLTACGTKIVKQYVETECPTIIAPEEPKFLHPNFFDTENGRKFCTDYEGAKYLIYNVKQTRDALEECRRIIIESGEKK